VSLYKPTSRRAAPATCRSSPAARAARAPPPAELSGYDKIALGVVRAIHFNANAIIPLSVAEPRQHPDLLDGDVVEVPCLVNANGARPLHVGPVPAQVRPLLSRVKEYERRTVAAALARSPDARPRRARRQPAHPRSGNRRPPRRRARCRCGDARPRHGLLQATATNIIGMVGVGPFLTIPFMITAMGGPHIIYAWAFGAGAGALRRHGLRRARRGAAGQRRGPTSTCAKRIARSASAA
jgi:hypothetical protein